MKVRPATVERPLPGAPACPHPTDSTTSAATKTTPTGLLGTIAQIGLRSSPRGSRRTANDVHCAPQARTSEDGLRAGPWERCRRYDRKVGVWLRGIIVVAAVFAAWLDGVATAHASICQSTKDKQGTIGTVCVTSITPQGGSAVDPKAGTPVRVTGNTRITARVTYSPAAVQSGEVRGCGGQRLTPTGCVTWLLQWQLHLDAAVLNLRRAGQPHLQLDVGDVPVLEHGPRQHADAVGSDRAGWLLGVGQRARGDLQIRYRGASRHRSRTMGCCRSSVRRRRSRWRRSVTAQ